MVPKSFRNTVIILIIMGFVPGIVFQTDKISEIKPSIFSIEYSFFN